LISREFRLSLWPIKRRHKTAQSRGWWLAALFAVSNTTGVKNFRAKLIRDRRPDGGHDVCEVN